MSGDRVVARLTKLGNEPKSGKAEKNDNLMRIFNIQSKRLKGELQPLLEGVQRLNAEDISEDHRETLKELLVYSQLMIPDHNTSSTGRIATVLSSSAIDHFGKENAQMMFNILNRISLSMISK